jgi:hypothetical protein
MHKEANTISTTSLITCTSHYPKELCPFRLDFPYSSRIQGKTEHYHKY